jgi:hypothetical protein
MTAYTTRCAWTRWVVVAALGWLVAVIAEVLPARWLPLR